MNINRKIKFCDRQSNGLLRFANLVIKIVGIAIFLFLLWYSMRYTYYEKSGGDETMLIKQDSILLNLLVGILVAGIVWGLTYTRRLARLIPIITVIWFSLCCIFWVFAGDRPPQTDPRMICDGVVEIMQGDYHRFQPNDYFHMYPQQLGLAALIELMFRLFGVNNYFSLQVLNVLLAIGIFTVGYFVTKELAKDMLDVADATKVSSFYCLFMCFCSPLMFYTTWIYGELPFLFFCFLAFWMLLRYEKHHSFLLLTAMIACCTIAVILRQNAWIVVIALGLVLLIHLLSTKNLRHLVAVALLFLFPLLCTQGINKIYETRIGHELSSGIPAETWIAMGMQEGIWNNGWYNQYSVSSYWDASFDMEKVRETALTDIRNRGAYFAEHPAYAIDFYKEKILTQWNTPQYQSLFFNTTFGDRSPKQGTLLYNICFGKGTDILLFLCDRMQFVIYAGVLLYYLLAVKRKSRILPHMFSVALIGYFLFSILWEGKARYIFPCYVMMFPLAALGWVQGIHFLSNLHRRHSKRP